MPCKTRVVMYRNKKETNFVIILKFFQIYLFHVLFSPHVCVPHMCMVSMELEEGSRSTAIGLTRGCEPSCGWQESNLGSLKGQSCWPISLQLFVMLICSNCKEIFIYKSFHVNYRGSGLFCSVCLCVPVSDSCCCVCSCMWSCSQVCCSRECCSCSEAESRQSLVRDWWPSLNIFQKYFKFKNFKKCSACIFVLGTCKISLCSLVTHKFQMRRS